MEKSLSFPIRLDIGDLQRHFERADIKFTGIEQAGESFECRVFLNNPSADEYTPPTKENGYAGSFHVYGYGLWPGDIAKDPSDRDRQHAIARAPIEKVVIATEAVRAAVSRGPVVTVTAVPVFHGQSPKSASAALTVQDVSILLR